MSLLPLFRVCFGLLQLVEQWLSVRLKNVSELVKDSIFCIVNSCVFKDQKHVSFESVSLSVEVFVKLLFHFLEPHWLGDYCVVVGGLALADGLPERPGVLVIVQRLQDIFALLLKSLLFSAFCLLVILLCPSSLLKTPNLRELEVFIAFEREVECWVDLSVGYELNFLDEKFSLFLNDIRDVSIVYVCVDFALHHR